MAPLASKPVSESKIALVTKGVLISENRPAWLANRYRSRQDGKYSTLA
jgi:hypothetical protein